jgi:GT2 family glycosyltransferase
MTPKVYILLPVHNRRHITKDLVECLLSQSFKNYHLVLIDDGSTDGTAEMIRGIFPNATVLQGRGDWWWAGCLQQGIDWLKKSRVTESDIVLFINDDVTFKPDYLANAVAYIKHKNELLLLSKFFCEEDGNIKESGVVADLKRLTFKLAKSSEEINCLSTRGLFVRFGDIEKIGDFHPRLLPHYLSDYEYTIRAARKGMRCETTDLVYLCPKLDSTGYRNFGNLGFLEFLRKYLSIKSAENPVYWSAFVLLGVPGLWVLPNLGRVWCRAARAVTGQVVVSANNAIRKVHWKR